MVLKFLLFCADFMLSDKVFQSILPLNDSGSILWNTLSDIKTVLAIMLELNQEVSECPWYQEIQATAVLTR